MEKTPLGGLPAELRNNIFELCLELDLYITVALHKAKSPVEDAAEVRAALQITTLCKQIRQETKTMFFALNSFHLETDRLQKAISCDRRRWIYGYDGYINKMCWSLAKFGAAA